MRTLGLLSPSEPTERLKFWTMQHSVFDAQHASSHQCTDFSTTPDHDKSDYSYDPIAMKSVALLYDHSCRPSSRHALSDQRLPYLPM
jgi:hypothetical protein